MNTEWELIVEFIGVIIAGIGSFWYRHRLLKIVQRPRMTLKTDLEILQMFDRDRNDLNYRIVKTDIDRRVQSIYQPVLPEKMTLKKNKT